MVDRSLINKWLEDGTIAGGQAEKMLADISRFKKEKSSNRMVAALSTIGAILLGVGVILLVASNWEKIPNVVRVLMLVVSTYGSCYAGYLFKYEKKNFPVAGASLLFLGGILFGATIFLLAQIYHVNANAHYLVLLWMIGVLPLVYVLESPPLAGLASLLYFIWAGTFISRVGGDFLSAIYYLIVAVYLILIAAILLFEFGALHHFSERAKKVARPYRLSAILVAMPLLFLFTFWKFQVYSSNPYGWSKSPGISEAGLWIAGLAVALTAIHYFLKPPKTKIEIIESAAVGGLLIVALWALFSSSGSSAFEWLRVPKSTAVYVFFTLFNLLYLGIIAALFYTGYEREDMTLINVGMLFLFVFILARYFDFFWGLLDRAVFFMIGGLILILGGIALERKRKQLRERFGG